MKSLYAIEVRSKENKMSSIAFDWSNGKFAIYDYEKEARNNLERLYQEYKIHLKNIGHKQIPRKDFVIKEYREVEQPEVKDE